MSLAYTVMSGNNFQSCTVNLLNHIIRVIHLAVPICHDRKVNTRHGKTKRCWFILLSIPECFHDIQRRACIHHLCCTGENTINFLFREAIQELAHPNCIPSSLWSARVFIKNIRWESTDTVCSFFPPYILLHHTNLTRKIHYRDIYFRIISHTTQRKTPCISTNIH